MHDRIHVYTSYQLNYALDMLSSICSILKKRANINVTYLKCYNKSDIKQL